MIECSLQPVISRYSNHDSKKPKYGVYLQSMYWGVKGYGKSTWVVSVKIELDYDKVKEDYENDDEIISKCIEYLNTPPKSKYGKRRKRKPLYTFDTKPYSFEIIEKKSKKLISARLITKERKNKHFWNAGPSL